MRNEICEFKTFIPLDSDYTIIETEITNVVFSDLYSYFVGRKNDMIVIKTRTSTIIEYNTIPKEEAKERIITSIVDYLVTLSDIKCIAFGQPPLELMIKLYQPMLRKMADKIHHQWKQFDYDDLVSMANFAMVKLYKQGYYVNKSVVWTSLNNDVLMECRNFRYQPTIVSFEDVTKSNIKVDDEKLTYGDMIKDESIEEEKENEDGQQLEKYIFEQVKDIIIDKIGVRRWDRLWRDYSKGHTTNVTQQEMKKLKSLFKELGLTREDFINYYRR